jgi:betaine-aldehyde dehydrogenase
MRSALYLDGRWITPLRGGTLAVIDPATAQIIHRAPAGTAEDINRAVEAARAAFDHGPWARMAGAERGRYLRLISEGILARKGELARLEVLDNGKPLPEADWDVADAAGCFEFYAGMADEFDSLSSEEIVLPDARFSARAVREPLGVVGAIIPWNYPLLMASWKIAPALAAGCTVVLKPSELTPLSALELASIADDVGLPPGVLNVVTGTGGEAGETLSQHPLVDKVAFTGSVTTGRKILAGAAQDIKRVSLELGGKSPFLVFEDAVIEKAVEWILFGIFWNQGQVCSATSRVLVHTGLYERLLARLIEETNRIRIGPGLAAGTLLGPLISQGQMDRVLAAVVKARGQGAKVVAGGTAVVELAPGYFIRPTILADVPTGSEAWQEEIFGPVVSIRRFADEAEAIRLANDSRFGLAAAVMSEDEERACRVAAALRAGIVWINCSQPTFTQAPWGGYKQSGIGRELGRWGLESYLETKQITCYRSDQPWGWYLK